MNFGLYEGCTNRDTVEITQIDDILINGVIFDVDCYGNSNGRVSVHPTLGGSVSGGSPNSTNPLYNYTWNPSGVGVGRTINNLLVAHIH